MTNVWKCENRPILLGLILYHSYLFYLATWSVNESTTSAFFPSYYEFMIEKPWKVAPWLLNLTYKFDLKPHKYMQLWCWHTNCCPSQRVPHTIWLLKSLQHHPLKTMQIANFTLHFNFLLLLLSIMLSLHYL